MVIKFDRQERYKCADALYNMSACGFVQLCMTSPIPKNFFLLEVILGHIKLSNTSQYSSTDLNQGPKGALLLCVLSAIAPHEFCGLLVFEQDCLCGVDSSR